MLQCLLSSGHVELATGFLRLAWRFNGQSQGRQDAGQLPALGRTDGHRNDIRRSLHRRGHSRRLLVGAGHCRSAIGRFVSVPGFPPFQIHAGKMK